ncbi:MAG: SMP-30/gluconolactonase/LRE family protein [Acidobacteriota bacterium]
MLRRFLLVLITPIVLVAAYLSWMLLSASPIDPEGWNPPPAPKLEGVLIPNLELRQTERLAFGQIVGAEDVAVDARGRIYGGLVDGRIIRLDAAGGGLETFAETGGRPLGLHFDAAGNLVVADAAKGLLRVDPDGAVEVLTTESDGLPFRFTDDLDIASDGRIYFSDASSRFDHHHYLFDLLEARPHGRLLRYDPASGITETLLDGLYFANGIALSQNEDFVLVVETYRYRIQRYWLTGPRAGTAEVFVENLPGFPDGVSANRRGTFWVACFTVRNTRVDALHPRPDTKAILAKLPKIAWPKPANYGLVIGLDETGRVVRTLQDPGGDIVPQVTSAEEVDGVLYLGNLDKDFIGRVAL